MNVALLFAPLAAPLPPRWVAGLWVFAMCVAAAARLLLKKIRGPLPAYGSKRAAAQGPIPVRPRPLAVRHPVPAGAEPRRW